MYCSLERAKFACGWRPVVFRFYLPVACEFYLHGRQSHATWIKSAHSQQRGVSETKITQRVTSGRDTPFQVFSIFNLSKVTYISWVITKVILGLKSVIYICTINIYRKLQTRKGRGFHRLLYICRGMRSALFRMWPQLEYDAATNVIEYSHQCRRIRPPVF